MRFLIILKNDNQKESTYFKFYIVKKLGFQGKLNFELFKSLLQYITIHQSSKLTKLKIDKFYQ